MRRPAALVLLALATLCPVAFAQEDSAIATEWQQQGIIITGQDLKDVKWFMKQSDELRRDYRAADQALDAFKEQGNREGYDESAALKARLAALRKQLPDYKPGPTFLKDLQDYREQRFLDAADDIRKARERLGQLRVQAGLPETLERPVDAEGNPIEEGIADGTLPGGTGTGTGPVAGGSLWLYVEDMSGECKFWIDGAPVEYRKTYFAPQWKDESVIRAQLWGPKRKQAMEFIPSPNTVDNSHDEWHLMYEVKSGDFNAKTTWNVARESYTWNVSYPRPDGDYAQDDKSKVKPFVEGDAMKIKWKGTNKFTLGASGEVEWKATASGGRTVAPVTDTGQCQIVVAVTPKL